MQKLHFTTIINAPVEKVWNTMFDDNSYREWTSVFMPGSYYEGSWDKGSRIRFLAPDEDGTLGGMISVIEENNPYEFVSIKHLGMVKKGIEDTTSDEVKKWAGAYENYTFKESNGATELTVEIDSDEEWTDMFEEMWPKALEKLKKLAEA